jgi:phosphoenolpyruvate carboxylase
MAVFIKRERLGSTPPQERMARAVERSPYFHAVRDAMAKAKAKQQSNLKGKFDDNVEVQNRRKMSKEDRARDAIEAMIPTAKEITELRTGKECSMEDARKVAENIAYKAEKIKEEK